MAVRERAQAILLETIHRVLTGRSLPETDARGLRKALRTVGFRHVARAHLLETWLGGRERAGSAPLVVSALGGRFPLAVHATDSDVGRSVLETGAWEPHLVALYRRLVQPGDAIVDVGANVGFHALNAALLAGRTGRVVAFEPDPANARLLELSLHLARRGDTAAPLAPVEIVRAALAGEPGTIYLSDCGHRHNSGARFTARDRARLDALAHGPAPNTTRVPALVFDDAYPDLSPDLVKIDVEGFEPHVVRGMQRTLARDRPLVVCEFAPGNLRAVGDTDPRDFLDRLAALGYTPHLIDRDGGTAPCSAGEAIARAESEQHADLLLEPR